MTTKKTTILQISISTIYNAYDDEDEEALLTPLDAILEYIFDDTDLAFGIVLIKNKNPRITIIPITTNGKLFAIFSLVNDNERLNRLGKLDVVLTSIFILFFLFMLYYKLTFYYKLVFFFPIK